MKIALLGYGKMGKVIERIALERGHEIVLRKTSRDNYDGLELADAAIEFSVPDAAEQNLEACLKHGIPAVCGTTGWLDRYPQMAESFQQNNGALLYGSNFSLGVNLFFELNEQLARLMNRFDQYRADLEEVHHTQKLDAPSGTAISLANGIIANSHYNSWTLKEPLADQLHIDAKRIENVPGTHTVFYRSQVDTIEITHTAHSREGFAYGAVIAAEWLAGKTGIFSMKDVLEL